MHPLPGPVPRSHALCTKDTKACAIDRHFPCAVQDTIDDLLVDGIVSVCEVGGCRCKKTRHTNGPQNGGHQNGHQVKMGAGAGTTDNDGTVTCTTPPLVLTRRTQTNSALARCLTFAYSRGLVLDIFRPGKRPRASLGNDPGLWLSHTPTLGRC